MLPIIIYILIITIVFFILYKVIKTFWKVILFTFLFILITIGTIGYLVYNDVKAMMEQPKLIILESNQEIQTGYRINKDQQEVIPSEKLKEINEKYKTNSLASITEGEYKLIILNSEMFKELPDQINYQNVSYSKKALIDSLNSNTSEEFLNRLGIHQENIIGTVTNEISEEDLIKYKAAITGILIFGLSEKPKNLIKQIDLGNIRIYPSSITLIIIKQMPPSLLEPNLRSTISTIKLKEK